MDVRELEIRLKKEGIRPEVYSLYGADLDESLVLSQMSNGWWQIYYSERGIKTNIMEYFSEEEACDAFLKILLNDPLAKK